MNQELEVSLRLFLLSREAVTDELGVGHASARIRPDAFDESDDYPAIVIQVDNEAGENDLEGQAGLHFAKVMIICRAEEKQDSRRLAEAVRTNRTDPGTGLAGYSGLAGTNYIGAVHEDTTTSIAFADDGSDKKYYDTNCDYTISFQKSI